MPEETSDQTNQRLHAVVHGRVQGVNFRAYTAQQAAALGLTGWIRNLPDGTVETIAEGPKEQLKKYEAYLHLGSPYAVVDSVSATYKEATNQFSDFRVRFL
ncbi:MAG: acylphosphatase [Anaerolineae bacterium]|nr:acylphosphatase [Anaerolineae bacterium]